MILQTNMPNDYQIQIDKLRADLFDLNAEIYSNNFSSLQDFNKYSRFNSRLRVPVFSTNPTVGEVGDIVSINGTLKICTTASATAPVFTVVGLQT